MSCVLTLFTLPVVAVIMYKTVVDALGVKMPYDIEVFTGFGVAAITLTFALDICKLNRHEAVYQR
ncbi:MAG: hypothetical protein ACK4SY_10100 [Pyrobaculum sp.]